MKKNKITLSLAALTLGLALVWTTWDTPKHSALPADRASSGKSADLADSVYAQEGTSLISHPASTAPTTGSNTQGVTGAMNDDALPPGFSPGDDAASWAKVDLDALQAQMPDNLYWTLAAPTQDAAVLAQRKELKEYWEDQYAKINANLASEEEIRAYFEYREQKATDYVEFATALLHQYGDELSEQAHHFQVFARNLNVVQLQELPRKLTHALENRKRFIAKREAWLKDKTAYEARLAQEREAALRDLGKI